jgi:hypothetical protein
MGADSKNHRFAPWLSPGWSSCPRFRCRASVAHITQSSSGFDYLNLALTALYVPHWLLRALALSGRLKSSNLLLAQGSFCFFVSKPPQRHVESYDIISHNVSIKWFRKIQLSSQHSHLVVSISNSKQYVDDFVGEMTFSKYLTHAFCEIR